MVQDMSIKDISYLELLLPFGQAKHSDNFGRSDHEQFCVTTFNLDQSFRICPEKKFLNKSSDSPFVQWSGTKFW